MNTRRTARLAAVALIALAGVAQAADTGKPLDRAALIKLANDYLGALVAHTPGKVPLASDVKTVENAKRIQPGEGLWKTTSAGPTEFQVVVPDTTSQQVGGIFMIQSDNKPAEVGLRLKVVNGKITEAEHMVAYPREQFMTNLLKVRPGILMDVPYEYRDSRGRLLHIAKSYYDALDLNNGSLAPFAPDCDRHENGFRTAPNGGAVGGGGMPGGPPRAPGPPRRRGRESHPPSPTHAGLNSTHHHRREKTGGA